MGKTFTLYILAVLLLWGNWAPAQTSRSGDKINSGAVTGKRNTTLGALQATAAGTAVLWDAAFKLYADFSERLELRNTSLNEEEPCPQVIDPVCGSDGKTYLNSCYAEKAGVSYTPGVCNPDCVDPSRMDPNAVCPEVYQPVCGCNGETYSNPCEAEAAGVKSYTTGPCKNNNQCYDPNYVITAAYTEIGNNGVIIFTTPSTNDPVCGCNGVTYKNSYVAEANGITFYTKGKCATNCVDPAQMDPNAQCTKEYEPVCGCNGVTYANACVAKAAGVVAYTSGVCGGNNSSAWCSKATPIDCGNFLSNETTTGAGNNITNYPCSAKNYAGPERVYIINKTSAGDLQIGLEILTANLDLDLFLLQPNCSQVTCLKSSTTSNTQTNNEGIILEDAPTGTYYLVVDGAAAGQYRLELSCGYLFCGDAIALECGVNYNGKNNDGQDNISLYGCSGGVLNVENNGPEKIHTFTLIEEGEVSISLTNLSANLELFLLKDCDRGSCLEFSQNNGNSNESITTTLPAGTYYIVVDGYNGATSNYRLRVDCAAASCNLDATLTPTAASCGQNNGAFNVHTTGGNPTYIITWSGPVSGTKNTQSNNTLIDDLPAGTYEVVVTDRFGCKVFKKVSINSGGNLGIQTTVTNASCNQSGKVKVTVSNGTAPFKVYLSGAANNTYTVQSATFNIEGLQSGTYEIYIVDANGCSASREVIIEQSGGNFTFTATPNAAACENPGSIAIKTSNGRAPYKVFVTGPKSGSVTVNANNFTIQELPGGTYTIKIEDASGCTSTTTVTIISTELSAAIAAADGNCEQAGSIKINIATGKPNFMITWDGPGSNDGSATTASTAYTIPNLPAGTYLVTIKDGNWCTVNKTVTVTGGSSGLNFQSTTIRGGCTTPGSIGITITPGKAPYEVKWDGPASNDGSTTTSNTTLNINSLPIGNYNVTIKDANGCSVTKTIRLEGPEDELELDLRAWPGTCGQPGSISVDVDEGIPVYKISWQGPVSGSATSQDDIYPIKDIPPGTYSITATDGGGCTASGTIVLRAGAPGFDLELTPKRGICETPGAVGINISGGKAPYKVSWDGPGSNDGGTTTNSTKFDIPNLPAGAYSITVKDDNGCVVTKISTLLAPEGSISVNLTATSGNCGQPNSILVDVDGGQPVYKISWEGPVSGAADSNSDKFDIKNLPAGNYTIKVFDKNWCSATKSITVNSGTPGIDIKLTAVNVICETPGSIKITIEGGKAPYKISWDGPGANDGTTTINGTSYEISNLTTGSYAVTVKDANNCEISKSTQISIPESNLALTLTVTQGVCGQPNKILVDVDGGAPAYKISWQGPVSGETSSNTDKYEINNIPAGVYTVKVVDKNWCTISKAVTINAGAPELDIALVPTNGICETPGSIKVKITGGKAPFAITWNGPGSNDGNANTNATTYDIVNLPAGSYTIVVKDANNCTVTSTTQVATPSSNLSLKLTVTEGNCGQPSKILVDVDGGSPAYLIVWDGPVDGEANSNSDKYEINNLPPGTYTIKVYDKNWCLVTKTVTVTGGVPGFDFKLTATNVICEMPGAIKVTIEGGKAPYKITWDGPGSNDGSATANSTVYEIGNLPSGAYTITVKDANNCTITKVIQVSKLENSLSLKLTVTEGNCGQPSKILVDVDGGAPAYLITWDGPVDGEANSNSDKYEINNVPAGTYTIKVFDKNWCSISKTVVVIGGSPGFDFKLTSTNGVCETPGAIKIVIEGGKPSYQISWDGPGSNDGSVTTNSTTHEISGLPSGSYTVTVKDGNNCVIVKTIQVSKVENSLSLKLTVTEGNCGQPSKILVDVDGGAPAYLITWEGPVDGEANSNSDKYEINNVPAGTYTIKVFDKNWCSISKTVVVTGGSPGFSLQLTPVNGICETPGTIKVKIEGGKAPYKITWDGPGSNDGSTSSNATSFDIANLPAGNYTVTVKDANNCEVSKATQISVGENSVTFVTTIKDATCLQSGAILVDVNGGTAPYKISWDGPGNNDGNINTNSDKFEIVNLIPGTYAIKVVDANWCTFSKTVTVGGSTTGVDIELTSQNGICETPGGIKIKILTGQAPFKISWDGPGSTDGNVTTNSNLHEISGLPAGNYSITVKDANNCTVTKTTQISVPESNLQITLTALNGACGQNGSIKVNVSGGSPNFIIEWDGIVDGSTTTNASNFTINNLPAGSYTIKVTDANWCTTSKVLAVASTPANLFTATPTHGTCDAPGSIKLNLSGGATPYSITWTGNNTPVMTTGSSYVINNLPAGSYTVKVTDNQGCTDTKIIVINANQSNLQVQATLQEGNCGEASKVLISFTGGTAKYKIEWAGPQNGSVQQVSATNYELTGLPAGKYNITVTDANWCMASTTITVVHSSGDLFKAKPFNGTCESFGSIRLSLIGGMPVYQVSWTGPTPGAGSTSDTAFVLQNLAPGTYTIKVTDKKGCVETETVVLSQNQSNIDFDAALIINECGQYNTIWIDINTGMPTYTIKWDGPGNQDGSGTTNTSGFEIEDLPSGKYTITVFDKNWCYADTMITIYSEGADVFSATPTQGTCGQFGAIKLNFGGTPPYKVKWDGPVDGDTTINASMYVIGNLPSGSYILTVTDAKGCSEKDTIQVVGDQGLIADIDGTNGNCSTEGKISVNITTGQGPFAIIYKGMGITDTVTVTDIGELVLADLEAGNYTVTVRSQNSCSVSEDVTISITESQLDFSTSISNATCGAAGKARLNLSGGDTPYTITWSGNGVNQTATTTQDTFTIANLPAGTYTVTVKDDINCSVTKQVKIITAENNLEVLATVTNGACGQTGQVLVSASGGVAPFTYQWSGPANGSQTVNTPSYTINNLNSGTYNITVTDGGGCSKTRMVSVNNNNQMPSANFAFTINGMNVVFTNQSTPGSYQWTFGDQANSTQNNPNHTYLTTGTFNVCLKVTNSCGAKEICKEVTIGTPAGAVNIDVRDGAGGKGEIVYIPVVIENCVTNTLVSLAGSLQIENTNVAVITGILPGSISPQYSAANRTFSYYANNGSGVPCGAGQILFYVAVELKGNAGTSTILRIVNTPLAIEVGGMANGGPTSIPHIVSGGTVSIQSIAVLQGDITTYWGDALPHVEVNINGGNLSKKDTTDNNGKYKIPALPLGKEYTVLPKLNDNNPANGLSTYALFAGQRFIIGMQPAEIVSPYQIIAGDANCDGRFTSLDLFIIQRLIIGTSQDFGACPSWVFVKAGEQMPVEFTATNVFPYHNCDTMMLMKDTSSNFIGVKVGDILGHANPQLLNIEQRSLSTLRLIAQNRAYRAGDIVEIALTSEEFREIAGYQMGLSFDANHLEFLALSSDAHSPFARIALNDAQAKNGLLRLSWFDPSGQGISTQVDEQLFTLRFVALQDIDNLANLLEVNSRFMRAEAYTTQAERKNITLQFISQPLVEPNEQVAVGYKLYQNVPNPFNQQTVIGFDLPQDMQADLIIFDQLGRIVKTFNGNYSRGYNRIEFPRETLGAGMYYYTLRTANFAQTKSMIIFE